MPTPEAIEMDESIKRTAKMLCAAYWRGKLEHLPIVNGYTREQMIRAASDTEWENWKGAAKVAVFRFEMI